MTTEPLQLVSQYVRRESGADSNAVDATGQDWYRTYDLDLSDLSDQDFPVWPPCVACGRLVDMLHEPCWFAPFQDGMFLHDRPECVRLVYPEEQPNLRATMKEE